MSSEQERKPWLTAHRILWLLTGAFVLGHLFSTCTSVMIPAQPFPWAAMTIHFLECAIWLSYTETISEIQADKLRISDYQKCLREERDRRRELEDAIRFYERETVEVNHV